MTSPPIAQVFQILNGPSGVARKLAEQGISITPWACNKWLRAGRLPRTDYTGETNYAAALERAVGGQVSAQALLEAGRTAAAG
jgi:hypothetical protein